MTVGSAGVHKKFGAMSASGNRRHKLKSTDSGGSGSSATVTVEKVMSDLMRQEKEDKRNIDEDRIARGKLIRSNLRGIVLIANGILKK